MLRASSMWPFTKPKARVPQDLEERLNTAERKLRDLESLPIAWADTVQKLNRIVGRLDKLGGLAQTEQPPKAGADDNGNAGASSAASVPAAPQFPQQLSRSQLLSQIHRKGT